MLAGLQDIKLKQSKSSESQLSQTISDFTNAGSSDDGALDFYIEAVRVTRFVGQPHEDTAFRDWKKKEMLKLNAPAIRAALRYTTISLQRAAGATDEQIFPVVLEYAQDTDSMLPSIADQEIVQQPVSENIFAKWYNLGEQLSALQNWEPVPGNVDNIYAGFILPIMRKNKDPRLLQYWESKLATETARASTATAQFATDRFNLSRRPQLLWDRAEDMIVIGQRDQGLNEMYTIVKNFPNHPDAGKWIDELKGLLINPSATPGLAAATSGTSAPPAPALR